MAIKESEEHLVDYEFMSKYLRDDSDKIKEKEESFLPVKFGASKSGSTEVFSSIGEGESYPENNNFNNRFNNGFKKQYNYNNSDEDIPIEGDFDDSQESGDFKRKSQVTSSPKPITEAKREFLKHLEDESLSIDTCSKINHDWERK
jgi:hypothetical protein